MPITMAKITLMNWGTIGSKDRKRYRKVSHDPKAGNFIKFWELAEDAMIIRTGKYYKMTRLIEFPGKVEPVFRDENGDENFVIPGDNHDIYEELKGGEIRVGDIVNTPFQGIFEVSEVDNGSSHPLRGVINGIKDDGMKREVVTLITPVEDRLDKQAK